MTADDRRGPIQYKKGASNVVTNLSASTRRRVVQVAAVGAVALVLAGTVASPAEARRRDSVNDANRAIGVCFSGGGEPNSYESGGSIFVSCSFEDGTFDTVEFPYR